MNIHGVDEQAKRSVQ